LKLLLLKQLVTYNNNIKHTRHRQIYIKS